MIDRGATLLVVGAGPVGLAIAKAFKDAGIAYDHVEADDGVGGNWRHGVYESAHIISSRRTTEYADFPMPAGYPDFPSRAQLLDYFERFAATFGLTERLEPGTRVVHVRPVEDDRWEVTLQSGECRRYKGIAICNGHHWDRRLPAYPGTFTGELIHSKDYRRAEQLAGRRVLVIGGGNSACDIASEAARVAAVATISLRRGYWFLPKTLLGRPSVELVKPWMPIWLQRVVMRALLRIVVGRYEEYGLPAPDHRLYEHHPTVSTEILHYLKHGRLAPRPDVRRFDGPTVEFMDGRREEYDLVVAATGYHVSVPFLAPGVLEVKGPIAQVVAGCLVPGYRHLYVIGTTQPRYGLGPLVTPAAKLLATMVRLQDGLAHPLADVLQSLGVRPPESHLIDPHQALRQLRRAARILPAIVPWADRRLAKRRPVKRNPVSPPPTGVDTSLPAF